MGSRSFTFAPRPPLRPIDARMPDAKLAAAHGYTSLERGMDGKIASGINPATGARESFDNGLPPAAAANLRAAGQPMPNTNGYTTSTAGQILANAPSARDVLDNPSGAAPSTRFKGFNPVDPVASEGGEAGPTPISAGDVMAGGRPRVQFPRFVPPVPIAGKPAEVGRALSDVAAAGQEGGELGRQTGTSRTFQGFSPAALPSADDPQRTVATTINVPGGGQVKIPAYSEAPADGGVYVNGKPMAHSADGRLVADLSRAGGGTNQAPAMRVPADVQKLLVAKYPGLAVEGSPDHAAFLSAMRDSGSNGSDAVQLADRLFAAGGTPMLTGSPATPAAPAAPSFTPTPTQVAGAKNDAAAVAAAVPGAQGKSLDAARLPDYTPTPEGGTSPAQLYPGPVPTSTSVGGFDKQPLTLASTPPASAGFQGFDKPVAAPGTPTTPTGMLASTTPGADASTPRYNPRDPFGTRGLDLASTATPSGTGSDLNLPGQAPSDGARLAGAYPPAGKTDASNAASNPATGTGAGMFGLPSGADPVKAATDNLAGAVDATKGLFKGFASPAAPSNVGTDATPSGGVTGAKPPAAPDPNGASVIAAEEERRKRAAAAAAALNAQVQAAGDASEEDGQKLQRSLGAS